MATYKVLQDNEAEDKLVGPLSLRQVINAGIAGVSFYLTFLSVTKGVGFLAVLFMPVGVFTGFFAIPWGRDQPTEIWALAKIRFMIKPRSRIWNQSGVKEMVTVTAPKHIERELTDGLSQTEVRSRLRALADTIDSRGWAIKNVNVNLVNSSVPGGVVSDRLVGAASLPQEVSNIDVQASDDILDESANTVAHNFDTMIQASSKSHREQLMAQMKAPTPPPVPVQQPMQQMPSPGQPQLPQAQGTPNDYWFMQQPATVPGQAAFVDAPVVTPGSSTLPAAVPQAAMPTAEEQAMVEKFKAENESFGRAANGHIKTLYPLSEQPVPQPMQQQPMSQTGQSPLQPQYAQQYTMQQTQQPDTAYQQAYPQQTATQAAPAPVPAPKPTVTPVDQAAIMNLANNDDLDVATIARQAHKQVESSPNEVVISLR